MGKSGPMVMVNFLIALTDFTEENGATRVIPGSNDWDDYEDRGTPEMTIPAEMKAGDVIFFNGKVSHGGGANVTENERRRGLTIPLQPVVPHSRGGLPPAGRPRACQDPLAPRAEAPRLPLAVPEGLPRPVAEQLRGDREPPGSLIDAVPGAQGR